MATSCLAEEHLRPRSSLPIRSQPALVGGTGAYQSSLVVYFYLTIFFVISKFVRLPADLWWKRLIAAYEGDILRIAQAPEIESLISGDLPIVATSLVFMYLANIYFVVAAVIAFRIAHNLSVGRSFIAVLIGSAVVTIVGGIYLPVDYPTIFR
jgi:hypothetical protein